MLETLDAAAVRRWCGGGLEALRAHQREIDELNVYPVPDGDTGTNLVLTLTAAQEAVERFLAGFPGSATDGSVAGGSALGGSATDGSVAGGSVAGSPTDGVSAERAAIEPSGAGRLAEHPAAPGDVMRRMARGALLGARGNSGVIVSQILRGMADSFATSVAVRGGELARALRTATEAAYGAVARPVEGTVLSVVAAAADGAGRIKSDDLLTVARAAARSAGEALARTPQQLPALARAGVVDAGGRGLCLLLDALVEALAPAAGEPPAPDRAGAAATTARPGQPVAGPGGHPDRAGPGEPAPGERSDGPGTAGGRFDGLGTAGGRSDGLGTAGGRSDGPETAGGRSGGLGTDGGRSDGLGTVGGRSDGLGTDGGRSDGPGLAGGRSGALETADGRGGPAGGQGHGAAGAFGYEVQYLLDAEAPAVERLRESLAGMGDSLVVVGTGDGEPPIWNVHVHVAADRIGPAVEAGLDAGRPYRISVTPLDDHGPGRRPVVVLPEPGQDGPRGAVVVAAGDGLTALLKAEGAVVVDRNPSTAEMLAAITATHSGSVVLLPNDSNTHAVATVAAREAERAGFRVSVVPTRSPVQALAALAVRDAGRPFADDVIAMAEAAGACRYGEVCTAQRAALTVAGPCRAGELLGLVDGEVHVIGADLEDVSRRLLDRLLGGGGELVTLVLGADAPAGLDERLRGHVTQTWPFVEVQSYAGGQPRYHLLVGVE